MTLNTATQYRKVLQFTRTLNAKYKNHTAKLGHIKHCSNTKDSNNISKGKQTKTTLCKNVLTQRDRQEL